MRSKEEYVYYCGFALPQRALLYLDWIGSTWMVGDVSRVGNYSNELPFSLR